MFHKNFTTYRIFTLFCFFALISFGTNAQTITETWNPAGSTCIDGSGNYGVNVGSVNFDINDFSGCNITELDVRIRWSKSDGSCPNPTGTGNSFHNETSFRIQGPDGTSVILVQPGSYSGGTSIGYVTTRFNQGSGVASGTPSTGTFGPNGGTLNNFNGTDPVGTWTLFAGDNAGGDPLIIDWFQVIATSSGGNASEQGFGCGQWNVNAYRGRDWNLGGTTTIFGNYTEPNLTFDTRNRWASGSTPADASGYVGCDPGIDNHTIVSKRTCFTCDVYQIDVTNHDDEAKLFVDGVEVWSHGGCCDAHTNVWTGILDNSATVEVRHGEGGGGSHHGLRLTDVTTALNPGSHSTTTLTGCLGANYGNLNANAASGGTSAAIAGGTTTYQWQQSFNGGAYTDIGGATGEDYNPPALNAVGTYDFRRRVTDRCGNTAFTTPRRYNIIADPTISMVAAPTTICPGESTTLTATTASGTGTCTFRWQSSPDNSSWTTFATNTSNTQVVNNINSSTYYRVQRNCTGTGCNDPFSNSILINAVDNTNPVISCPGNVTANNDLGTCGAIVTYTAPVGTDNCPGPTTTQTAGLASGALFPIGTTTNTFRVTDAFGNFTECSFDVIITDAENPQITCPANITMTTSAGVCEAPITYTTPVGTDNCPAPTTVQTQGLASGANFPLGVTTNTFEVTDASGNTATCSFDVEITLDGIGLALDLAQSTACSNNGILTNQTGGSPVIGSYPGDSGVYTGLGVTDNGNGSFDYDPSIAGLGIHTIAYTYEDGAGCTYFITADIEVLEGPSASITCPDAVLRDCEGPFNCSPTDINPATLPSSTGSISGSAAAYVYGDPNPGGDLFIDLPNVPTDTPLELIYTLTSPDGCTSTASCTFEVVGKQANAGKY